MSKELSEKDYKKLKEIERGMKAINKKVKGMGYTVYLATNRLHIMSGPSHDDSNNCRPIRDNSVYNFSLEGWDGGDW